MSNAWTVLALVAAFLFGWIGEPWLKRQRWLRRKCRRDGCRYDRTRTGYCTFHDPRVPSWDLDDDDPAPALPGERADEEGQ